MSKRKPLPVVNQRDAQIDHDAYCARRSYLLKRIRNARQMAAHAPQTSADLLHIYMRSLCSLRHAYWLQTDAQRDGK